MRPKWGSEKSWFLLIKLNFTEKSNRSDFVDGKQLIFEMLINSAEWVFVGKEKVDTLRNAFRHFMFAFPSRASLCLKYIHTKLKSINLGIRVMATSHSWSELFVPKTEPRMETK